MNLTPEQLAWLKQATSQGGQFSNGNYTGQDGTFYQSNGNQGWGEDATGAQDQTGWYAYDQSKTKPGDQYTRYGMDGTNNGQGEFKDPGNGMDLLATGILTALSMGAFLPAAGGMAGAGGGAASGAGFLGEGALSGIGAWDGALSTSLSGAYGPAGLATAMGEGVTSGAAATGAATTAANAAGSTSGLLSTALKYGPGLLGGLMGGAGGSGDGNRSGTKQIDPRLLPYIYGDANNKGAFGYAKGLLDGPVAPNGFERFYGGR
jgi:hypothetical protein